MANVLVGVTGSVAAIKTSDLYERLTKAGHQVKIVATRPSLYFFDPNALAGKDGKRNPEVVILDEDEWPGRSDGRIWQRGEPVLHIELRRWADVLALAPLDANTLAKTALGLCDNCLTSVWRAWDRTRPIVLAPAMNTLMWEHPATRRHLGQIAADLGGEVRAELPLEELVEWINVTMPTLQIVGPINKRLACDDVGMGGMADVSQVVAAISASCKRPH